MNRRAVAAVIAAIATVHNSAVAEDVFVKYRGTISLDRFQCFEGRGSVVNRLCYRQDERYVVVRLKGTYYHYCLVPRAVVAQWLTAESMGRFYNQNVRENYDCRLGGIPPAN